MDKGEFAALLARFPRVRSPQWTHAPARPAAAAAKKLPSLPPAAAPAGGRTPKVVAAPRTDIAPPDAVPSDFFSALPALCRAVTGTPAEGAALAAAAEDLHYRVLRGMTPAQLELLARAAVAVSRPDAATLDP
jgi:hypothetical protein